MLETVFQNRWDTALFCHRTLEPKEKVSGEKRVEWGKQHLGATKSFWILHFTGSWPGQRSLTRCLGFSTVQVDKAGKILLFLLQLVLQPPHWVYTAAALGQQLHLFRHRKQARSPEFHIPTSAGTSGARNFVVPQKGQWLCFTPLCPSAKMRSSSKTCFLNMWHLHNYIK